MYNSSGMNAFGGPQSAGAFGNGGFGGGSMGGGSFGGANSFQGSPSGGGGGGSGGGRKFGDGSVRPVTVKQVMMAKAQAENDGVFDLDNRELSKIALVGRIAKVAGNGATSLQMMVEDGTGGIDVFLFIDESDQAIKERVKEDVYVKVLGSVRKFNEKKSVRAQRIIPIDADGFDEVIEHYARCAQVHLQLTRQPAGGANAYSSAAAPFGLAAPPSMGNGAYVPTGGGYNAPMVSNGGGGGDFKNQVLDAVQRLGDADENGVSVQMLSMELKRTPAEVQSVLEEFAAAGSVYSTVDDVHYKRC